MIIRKYIFALLLSCLGIIPASADDIETCPLECTNAKTVYSNWNKCSDTAKAIYNNDIGTYMDEINKTCNGNTQQTKPQGRKSVTDVWDEKIKALQTKKETTTADCVGARTELLAELNYITNNKATCNDNPTGNMYSCEVKTDGYNKNFDFKFKALNNCNKNPVAVAAPAQPDSNTNKTEIIKIVATLKPTTNWCTQDNTYCNFEFSYQKLDNVKKAITKSKNALKSKCNNEPITTQGNCDDNFSTDCIFEWNCNGIPVVGTFSHPDSKKKAKAAAEKQAASASKLTKQDIQKIVANLSPDTNECTEKHNYCSFVKKIDNENDGNRISAEFVNKLYTNDSCTKSKEQDECQKDKNKKCLYLEFTCANADNLTVNANFEIVVKNKQQPTEPQSEPEVQIDNNTTFTEIQEAYKNKVKQHLNKDCNLQEITNLNNEFYKKLKEYHNKVNSQQKDFQNKTATEMVNKNVDLCNKIPAYYQLAKRLAEKYNTKKSSFSK